MCFLPKSTNVRRQVTTCVFRHLTVWDKAEVVRRLLPGSTMLFVFFLQTKVEEFTISQPDQNTELTYDFAALNPQGVRISASDNSWYGHHFYLVWYFNSLQTLTSSQQISVSASHEKSVLHEALLIWQSWSFLMPFCIVVFHDDIAIHGTPEPGTFSSLFHTWAWCFGDQKKNPLDTC